MVFTIVYLQQTMFLRYIVAVKIYGTCNVISLLLLLLLLFYSVYSLYIQYLLMWFYGTNIYFHLTAQMWITFFDVSQFLLFTGFFSRHFLNFFGFSVRWK
jgi:hypothetical protein